MTSAAFPTPEPKKIWERFFELVAVPRPSKQERPAIEHLAKWAAKLGLDSRRDATGNLVVHVPSTKSDANRSAVILQCHVDIVAVTEPGSPDADATQGRIPMVRGDLDANNAKKLKANPAGDWINAPYTTLGADNGIGVAMMQALAEADHRPVPLQLLFTIDEEAGMTGAFGLDSAALGLNGDQLINIDTEDDDEITVGAAGGRDVEMTLQSQSENIQGQSLYTLRLSGLKGGHSGVEINQGRGNAIRLMARCLRRLVGLPGVRIVDLRGGSRRNAIPDLCTATLAVPTKQESTVRQHLAECEQNWAKLYVGRDSKIDLVLEPLSEVNVQRCMDAASTQTLVRLLSAIQTGIIEMTPEIPTLVEASCNLAIVEFEAGATGKAICSVRGTTGQALDNAIDSLRSIAEFADAEVTISDGYPGWKPQLGSRLLNTAIAEYERLFSAKPKVHAIHAGLECGLLLEKLPGTTAISIGPTIKGNHAVGERVQISSVDKSYRYLQAILERLGSP